MTAKQLEAAFLGGLEDAQVAYEQILATEAWIELGHATYVDWWTAKVVPVMRALKMRPTRKAIEAGIQQVRKEEAGLPPLQRRTQEEIGEMFGVDQATVSRSAGDANASGGDLGASKPAGRRRRPLPEAARESASKLRKEVERLERVFGDDRFRQNADQVAAVTRSHLTYIVETAQRLLEHLNQEITR